LETGRPIRVAIVGGGCASIAAAFELTRPQHKGKYRVTVYQMGWRLGGKGASGRGPAGRIEEHGLHVWLGYYENAFRLLRECYAELEGSPGGSPFGRWTDAFLPDAHIGVADRNDGGWSHWTTHFPPEEGHPGDPLPAYNPFSLQTYLGRAVALLRTLLVGVESTGRLADERHPPTAAAEGNLSGPSPEVILDRMTALLRFGVLATAAAASEALGWIEAALKRVPKVSETSILGVAETLAAGIRNRLESVVAKDDEIRWRWEIIDLVLAALIGSVRFGLLSGPRGLDAINGYDCREWLRMNGASERALNSAFIRGLYDLAFAYEEGDASRPRLAAGEALRGGLRLFFGYRGAMFWKMRAGMGDVVFAPFYQALRRRGVLFQFFHRLENVRLVDPGRLAPGERCYVTALEFDVQAKVRGGIYRPLMAVKGAPCWPSKPDFGQLEGGALIEAEGWDFESHWDRRKATTRTLHVIRDFDFVVLGVGAGAIPFVCKELIERDPRWRAMTEKVKTVATQAFQLWLSEDLQQLGWEAPPVTLSGFVKPFDTWSDMGQVVPAEGWRRPPRTVAYFCTVLPDRPGAPEEPDVLEGRRAEVRRNAIAFLNRHVRHLWPKAVDDRGRFRWDLLVDPSGDASTDPPAVAGESRFDTQFWVANVNPTDRYTLSLPGSIEHRISPLDNTYDNLTVAGDWTDCAYNHGCVEAAMMSGRLAAHAIAGSPALEDIVAFDHP
jgi:uncharacterized protein with NAD-binding domain and iron-sulfur cluster